MTSTQLSGFGTEDYAALTSGAFRMLGTATLNALSTEVFAALGSDQIHGLTTQALRALHTEAIAAMNSDAIEALDSRQVASLTTQQLAAITSEAFATMSSDDLTALSRDQAKALTVDQIHAIGSDAIVGFETRDLAALSMDQVLAFSTETLHAMSGAQLDALFLATPIMLNLDGHGLGTVSAAQGVSFDLNNTGHAQQWGWMAQGNGLLARDLNGNGQIDSGAELFGTGTVLANGRHAANGYEAMQAMDANGDHALNALDAGFSQLRIWADANGNGKTDAGELKSLAELGIVELDLNARSSSTVDHGNLIGLISGYKTADGVTHQMGDVWFAKATDAGAPPTVPAASELLAAPKASENALLAESASGSTAVAPATEAANTASPASTGDTADHAHTAMAHAALSALRRQDDESNGSAPLL